MPVAERAVPMFAAATTLPKAARVATSSDFGAGWPPCLLYLGTLTNYRVSAATDSGPERKERHAKADSALVRCKTAINFGKAHEIGFSSVSILLRSRVC